MWAMMGSSMGDTVTFRPGDLALPSQGRSAFVRDAVRFYLAIVDNPRMAACILADRLHKRDSEAWAIYVNLVLPLIQAIREVTP